MITQLAAGLQFAHPWVLALLVGVAAVAVWLLWPRLRRRRAPKFLFSGTHKLPGRRGGVRLVVPPLLDVLFVVGLALVVVAMAGPHTVEREAVDAEGIDIFIAFDMSGSMQAIDYDREEVRDMNRQGETPPTRLEEARQTLVEFVDSRPYDRIGVVLFAREAVLQFPLTLDHELLKNHIRQLEMGDIDEDGTAIGNAVARSLAGLEDSDADTQLVLLITDGDRRGGNISPMQSAEMAKQMGVTIYPILVGREGEALVEAGQDPMSGQPVYRGVEFPIDPDLLERMAARTGGEYFRAHDAQAMGEDLHEILDAYDRTRLEDRTRTVEHPRHAPFVVTAVVLFSLYFLGHHTVGRRFP